MGSKSLAVGDYSRAVARALAVHLGDVGMSQAEVARRAGLSQTRTNLVLRAERAITVEETALICEAIGVSVSAILREAERLVAVEQAGSDPSEWDFAA